MPDEWNFADVFEAVAQGAPTAVAIIHGDKQVMWRDFDRRANALAADLLRSGVGRQGKVMTYLYNSAEYLETYYGAIKAAMVPVNVNYRYGPTEVAYLCENADAEAVVFDTQFADLLAQVRDANPGIGVRRWLAVGPPAAVPEWATPYEDAINGGADRPEVPWARSGDDLLMVYTGGTTGMPKGVMWAHDDLFRSMGHGGVPLLGIDAVERLDEFGPRAAHVAAAGNAPIVLQSCPLMHATALGNTFQMLPAGATIVLLEGSSFDAAHLWDAVAHHRVTWLTMVGDAFGRPLLAELDANPGRWDLQSLQVVYSSGVMWSKEVKQGLLRHLPATVRLVDVLGSTEAPGLGASVSSGADPAATAQFTIGAFAQVISESGGFVEPGSGEVGLAAFGGFMPRGYYKDEAKTAATFRVVNGKRWSVPGDFATVDADGTLKLLGRGSVCINTGGEKVFPEEVEEVLKLHPSVRDAVCVGVPDSRFGELVVAVVEPSRLRSEVVAAELATFVKARLAGYKAPRHVVVVDTIGRAPSGKVDYARLRAHARAELQR